MSEMTLGEALSALSDLCHSRDDRAALSVIERHVQDMERTLTAIANSSDWPKVSLEELRIYARAALPALEKGTE
jgi:hypothetical protein